MAQSLTVTTGNQYLRADIEPFRLVLDWVSATDGTVSLGIAETLRKSRTTAPFPERIIGKITAIETSPGLNGDLATSLPTANYDITMLDAYGADVSDGVLVDRSATAAEIVYAQDPIPVDSELTLVIANAGDTKKGRIVIHFE